MPALWFDDKRRRLLSSSELDIRYSASLVSKCICLSGGGGGLGKGTLLVDGGM